MMRTWRALAAALMALVGVGLGGPAMAAAPPPPKTLVVVATPTTAVVSQAVRLTATITPRGGGRPQGGTVTFAADGVPLGTAVATTRNTVLTTTVLPLGTNLITASYSGDGRTAPGTSAATTVTVTPAATRVTVAPTQARVLVGRRAEIKATVRSVAPASVTTRPTGRVTFTMSCKTGSVAVNGNGVATWRTTLCPGAPGNRTVRATYTGSDRHAASAQAQTTVRSVFPTRDQAADGDLGPDVPVESHDGSVSRYAQTFVAGLTGELTDISFGIGRDSEGGATPGPLLVTVQTVGPGGVPTGTVIGSGTVPTSAVDEGSARFITLALADSAAITTGTRYAIVFEIAPQPEDSFGRWWLWTTAGDAYGEPLHRDLGADWSPQLHDLAFTTFVFTT